MKNSSGQFKLNDYVEICSDSSYFNGKKGNIISINELTGSDAGCGDTITVKLDENGYEVDINIFTTLWIKHVR